MQHFLAPRSAAAGQPRWVLRERDCRREAEREDDAAEGGDEFAACEVGRMHAQRPPMFCAARSTARMIRLCVPQRHRLSASAARTSASRGFGLRLSRSAASCFHSCSSQEPLRLQDLFSLSVLMLASRHVL